MHVSGEHYNVRHPQKYVGALLHNAYEAEGIQIPRKQNYSAYLDNIVYQSPVDSCVRLYKDWTTDKASPAKHFIWLSEETMPFCRPQTTTCPARFHLGPGRCQ